MTDKQILGQSHHFMRWNFGCSIARRGLGTNLKRGAFLTRTEGLQVTRETVVAETREIYLRTLERSVMASPLLFAGPRNMRVSSKRALVPWIRR